MSSSTIKHQGEVLRIEGNSVFVRMTVNSACGGCSARSACGVSESEDKIVEVRTREASDFVVGEAVDVALASRSMGAQSVMWAYVYPFVVMCVVLVVSTMVGASEAIALLLTLGSVALYYVVLYLLRDKFDKTINFIIIKQTK